MTRATILVVDDHDASRAALAAALRERYEVQDVATVSAALAALPSADAVVLDLVLDDPVNMLVDVLAARGVPVVVVSGLEPDAAAELAACHGWSALAKPVAPDTLNAAVAAALEPPMPENTDARSTMAPPPPPREVTSAPPIALTDPSVARVDLITRRALRALCALLITGLTVWGDSTGHPVSGVTVAALGLLGVGAAAGVDAVRRRPAASLVGGAGLLLLALAGSVAHVDGPGTLAAMLVAGATATVDRARGVSP